MQPRASSSERREETMAEDMVDVAYTAWGGGGGGGVGERGGLKMGRQRGEINWKDSTVQ